MGTYSPSQISVLFTLFAANCFQLGQVLFGLFGLVHFEVGHTNIFMGALVVGIKLQRGMVVLERGVHLARPAEGVAKIVVHIRAKRLALDNLRKRGDCAISVLGFDGFFASGEISIGHVHRWHYFDTGGLRIDRHEHHHAQHGAAEEEC